MGNWLHFPRLIQLAKSSHKINAGAIFSSVSWSKSFLITVLASFNIPECYLKFLSPNFLLFCCLSAGLTQWALLTAKWWDIWYKREAIELLAMMIKLGRNMLWSATDPWWGWRWWSSCLDKIGCGLRPTAPTSGMWGLAHSLGTSSSADLTLKPEWKKIFLTENFWRQKIVSFNWWTPFSAP